MHTPHPVGTKVWCHFIVGTIVEVIDGRTRFGWSPVPYYVVQPKRFPKHVIRHDEIQYTRRATS